MQKHSYTLLCTLLLVACIPLTIAAQEKTDSFTYLIDGIPVKVHAEKPKRINLHFQTTYIYQYKPTFKADYNGPNSLMNREEKQNSLTATLQLGARLWKGAELYINPEVAGGSGLSGAFGVAANSNGETFRVGNPEPTLYLGRGYITQTISLDKDIIPASDVSEGANEIGGMKPTNFLKFYLGKLCLADLFDLNNYANSARTQYMNWCLMNNGAWDYAANTRGYTYAFVTMAQYKFMSYKAALALLPTTANGPELNTDLSKSYSINAEVSKAYTIKKKKGNVRLLAYYNNCGMGNYQKAFATRDTLGLPSLVLSRADNLTRMGVGLSADQELTNHLGVFMRAGWNDGKNETWCFTEADMTVSAGLSINGAAWKRKDDNMAFAIVMNGLSKDHRAYLAAGGLGFQLGDGALTYGNETALELYYNYKPFSNGIWLTGDYQFIAKPGYNKDRGPLNVFSIRMHVEL